MRLLVITGPHEDVSGTSLSAPQVAGLAALLMERDSTLQVWPEAVRAVIMASAIHNIEDDPRLSERHGAGAISTMKADEIVRAGQWPGNPNGRWLARTIVHPTNYEARGEWVSNTPTFVATQGQRIRVAIAWDSDPALDYSADALSTNLDLSVYRPDGQLLESDGVSNSVGNAIEIVDFIAPMSGTYGFKVRRDPFTSTEPSNVLGMAWTVVNSEAEPSLTQELSGPNKSDPVLVPVVIDRIIDTATNLDLQLPGGIGSYSAKVKYSTDPGNPTHPLPVQILGVTAGDAPFSDPVSSDIQNASVVSLK